MSKYKIFTIIIAIGVFCLFLACEDKTVTQSEETVQLSGYVFQEVNGYFSYISNTEIKVGDYTTTSDSLGKYSIDIPKGEYAIQAVHEQFDTTTTSVLNISSNRSYAIKMRNGPVHAVAGIVTDTIGAVVEGAIVVLEHLRDTTDINGEFNFQNIPSGQRIMSCDYSDYYIFSDSFEITNADISINIQLVRQGYNISGTVTHPVDGLLSGIEVVLDDSLYDTTDINGEYLFENIFIGEHQLQIHSSIYSGQTIEFISSKADFSKDFELTKPMIDTFWIEQDAMVQTHTYKPYDGISSTSSEDVNFGDFKHLEVSYNHLEDFSMIQGLYIDHWASRVFIKLPIIDFTNSDSVKLIFSTGYISSSNNIVISGLTSDWDESTITWEDQPAPNTNSIIILPVVNDSAKWIIKISVNDEIFSDTTGILIKYQNESCYYMCSSTLALYSSEYENIEKRPHILVYKTE